MTLPFLLALGVALPLFYWVWVSAPNRERTRREALLQAEGRASGATFFPVDQHRKLGSWEETCILFDPDARKACIVIHGKAAQTVDFEYFRTWQLKWNEDSRGGLWRYQHVHFLFETGNFDRPTIRVNVPSKVDGDDWNAKLSILMP